MNNFIRLKNTHKGEDIYVICSGPSLDWFSNDFFMNKTTIGINQIYKKIKTDYIVRKDPKFTAKAINIDSILLLSKHQHANTSHPLNKIENINSNNLYFYEHNCNTGKGQINYSNYQNKMIVSWSTTTTAIHIAAYMGAKNIILVAHDCGTINGKLTFNGYYNNISDTPWKNWKEYENWLSKIESQTLEVKHFIEEKYNCNIYSLNPFINFNLEGNIYKNNNFNNFFLSCIKNKLMKIIK